MSTSTFGACHCGAPAIVKLNREPLCLEHYDAALSDVAGMIRRAAELDLEEGNA